MLVKLVVPSEPEWKQRIRKTRLATCLRLGLLQSRYKPEVGGSHDWTNINHTLLHSLSLC